jgi:DNA repair protein SbcC/Rad50
VLELLRLKNWQCHADLTLPLAAVTVLAGDNGSGKSAILRALRYLALNDWEGAADDFVSWEASLSEVTVAAEGQEVVRQKGKGVNAYLLDGSPLAAFHPHVPKGVAGLLRLSEVNFQGQDDPAYWVSLSGAAAAEALNYLFDLSAIDTTAEAVGRELRRAKIDREATEDRLKKAEAAVASLTWTHDAEALLEEVGAKGQELDSLDQEIQRMNQVLHKLNQLERDEGLSGDALAAGLEALSCGEGLLKLEGRIDKLRWLLKLEEADKCLRKSLKEKEALLAEWLAGSCPLCRRSP